MSMEEQEYLQIEKLMRRRERVRAVKGGRRTAKGAGGGWKSEF